MSTPVPGSTRRLRLPAPGAAAPRQPVDRAKVGRSSVRRRATGMTATEAAAALEDARLQQHIDREDLADDERGPAEVAGRQIFVPGAAAVQDELAAEAEGRRRSPGAPAAGLDDRLPSKDDNASLCHRRLISRRRGRRGTSRLP